MLFLESLIFAFIKLFNYKDGGGNKKETYVWNLLKLKKMWIIYGYSKRILIFCREGSTPLKKRMWIHTNSEEKAVIYGEKKYQIHVFLKFKCVSIHIPICTKEEGKDSK